MEPADQPTVARLVISLLLSVAGHVLVNHLGYWLGIRDVRW
jgi:hypothetical protein